VKEITKHCAEMLALHLQAFNYSLDSVHDTHDARTLRPLIIVLALFIMDLLAYRSPTRLLEPA